MKLIINKRKDYAYFPADNKTIEYKKEYYKKLKNYEGSYIDEHITAGRVSLTEKYCKYGSVLDIGCGTGRFMRAYANSCQCFVYGYDIIPKTVTWLKKTKSYIDPYKSIPNHMCCIAMFDTLEHIPDHRKIFDNIPKTAYTLISVPIIDDMDKIKKWKHYRPNEHYHYWTMEGFKIYMKNNGFELDHQDDFEIKAGRTDIHTFVFRNI